MNRKECDNPGLPRRTNAASLTGVRVAAQPLITSSAQRPYPRLYGLRRTNKLNGPACGFFCAIVPFLLFAFPSVAAGGSIRLWPTAVVTGDSIQLSDVAEFRGFAVQEERALQGLVVAEAPPAGGSRILGTGAIRLALEEGNVNSATFTLGGAAECAVTRPTGSGSSSARPSAAVSTAPQGASRSASNESAQRPAGPSRTLKGAVLEFLNAELRPYGGSAEVVFDRGHDQVLELSGPDYAFVVRRRGNQTLGLVPLVVEVSAQGKGLQSVPLIVQVSMVRPTVIARRPINQGATIGLSDVELRSMTFSRIEADGVSSIDAIIGQRAKRFWPPGATIDAAGLESVPLVTRGQVVSIASTVGGIVISTTGKAQGSGRIGETVRVQAADKPPVEIEAVVVGPGKVRVGMEPPRSTALAEGRQRP